MALGGPISYGWRLALVLAGSVAFLLGLVDPLEGFVLVLAGGALVTYEAFRADSRWRKLLAYGLALVVAGSIAMVGLSVIGGVGGDSGRSLWWLLLALPYPLGALVVLVGGVLEVVEVFRGRPKDDASADGGAFPGDEDAPL